MFVASGEALCVFCVSVAVVLRDLHVLHGNSVISSKVSSLVFVHDSTLHYKVHSLELGDIREWVVLNGDNIRIMSRLDCAELIFLTEKPRGD